MKLPSLVLCLAFVSPCSGAAVPDPALVGCWRAVKIAQYFKDGSKAEDSSGRCTLRFKEDKLESSCIASSGTVTSTYDYRIARAGAYLATMTGSTFRTSLIGSTREYEYHVAGDRLTTSTNLHPVEPVAAGVAIRVATEAAKAECQ